MSDRGRLAATLFALDSALGVSGNEEEAAAVFCREMEGLCDIHETDALGNEYFILNGTEGARGAQAAQPAAGQRLLFTAHLDEVGFIVKNIDPAGFARIFPVGIHDERNVVNQELVFLTACGTRVYGVTGSKPAHILTPEEHEKASKISDIFIDFGTDSAAGTRALGLEIGDYGTFARPGRFLPATPAGGAGALAGAGAGVPVGTGDPAAGEFYAGKAVDDRAGLTALVEAARRLKGKKLKHTVCFAGTVQEEVGIRGAQAVAQRYKPTLMFAVDGTLTGGTPGYGLDECPQKMGGGVAIKFFDWDQVWTSGNNTPRRLTSKQIEIAQKHNIPFQREVIMGGGTDAWRMAYEGVLAGGIGIPMRYMHSAAGLVRLSDIDLCAQYIVHLIEDI